MGNDCPSESELIDYHLGRLSADEIDRITAHLEGCAACTSAIERLESIDDGIHAALLGQSGAATFGPARTDPEFPASDAPREGEVIGPYRLRSRIGEGGMGVVYMAAQDAPVRRRVALKVIKPGMDSTGVLRRFDAERQALALMDHPNVARIYDAGMTAQGRPYFVMELVEGAPITKYCDEARLSPAERTRLFIAVCRAVQHAHQKGIVHRDLKPSNVLVTLVDGVPSPKVIDFGVARAIDQAAAEQERFTQHGMVVGTLEYMSPEQAAPDKFDVDTRSDVYSLGALLYELLVGSTPLQAQQLREAGYAEMLRVIREDDPPKPSTRLSESRERLASIAATRGAEPSRLIRSLRGDIDWIVMRALEKDRGRRYDSPGAFAADLERFLAGDPVEAGPPSTGYRLRRFISKHSTAVLTIVAFMLLLVVGTVTSLVLMLRAQESERLARRRGDDLMKANAATASALTQAKDSLREAETVSRFLIDAFRSPDPSLDGEQIKVAQVLDRATDSLQTTFQGSDVTRAALLHALGMTYHGLGLYDRAAKLFEAARRIREAKLGLDDPSTLNTLNALVRAYNGAGRTNDCIVVQEEANRRATARHGRDDAITLTGRQQLGTAYLGAGRITEALALQEETVKLALGRFGAAHETTIQARNALAYAYLAAGRTAEAVASDELALTSAETALGVDHPITMSIRDSLALDYQGAGREADAMKMHKLTLAQREAKLGLEHPDTLSSRNSVAIGYQYEGRPAEAIPLHEANLRARTALYPPDHRNVLATRNNLAAAYDAVGRVNEAISLHEGTLKLCETKLGPKHPDTLVSRSALGAAYVDGGRVAEAIAMHEETLRLRKTLLGPEHPSTFTTVHNLALAYRANGQGTRAVELFTSLLEPQRRRLGPNHPRTLNTIEALSNAYESQCMLSDAVAARRLVIERRSAPNQPRDARLADTLSSLGATLLKLGRPTEAEPILRDALAMRTALTPDKSPRFVVMSLLGECLRRQGRADAAEPLLVEAFDRLSALPPDESRRLSLWLRAAALRLIDLDPSWQRPAVASRRETLCRRVDLPADVFVKP